MPNVSAMASAIARWKSLIRFVLGAVAVGLGFWGWTIKTPPLGWEDWFNNAFRTLQLVTLQFPAKSSPIFPGSCSSRVFCCRRWRPSNRSA